MPYKELIHRYQLQQNEDGTLTGSRTFLITPSGPLASLPIVGTSTLTDVNGDPISGCLARRIHITRDNADKDPWHTVHYSTRSSLATGTIGITNDQASRTYDSTHEILNIEAETWADSWKWLLRDTDLQSDPGIYARIVNTTFTIARHGLSNAQKDTLLGHHRNKAGTINNDAFDGYPEGSVLYDGLRGSDYIDSAGVRRWSFELLFIARELKNQTDYAGNPITKDTWLYVWNPEDGGAGWDIPVSKASNGPPRALEKSDFSTLLG
jgi:hypothetical protein